MRARRICKILTLGLIVALSSMFFLTGVSFASSDQGYINKVLFVVNPDEYEQMPGYLDNINNYYAEETLNNKNYNRDAFDYSSLAAVTEEIALRYKAVALPYLGQSVNTLAASLYDQGVIVYLYGNLTIGDYKAAVGLQDFSKSVDVYDTDGDYACTLKQGVGIEYENTQDFGIISFGELPLLCTFEEEATLLNYLVSVVENYAKLNDQSRGVVMVANDFDIVSHWGSNNQYSMYLDYYLYKETDETVAAYDYFVLETNAWIDTPYDANNLYIKYEGGRSSFEIKETGPESVTNVGEVSGSVGWDGGISVEFGYSLSLEDWGKPKIERVQNLTNDTVEWTVSKRALSLTYLNDFVFTSCMTFADTADGTTMVNIYYKGSSQYNGYGTTPDSPFLFTVYYTDDGIIEVSE